jgi:iron(II)-dependent oxidoreductase
VNVAFVLASYRRDAPAGMERSVAALCAGLRQLGHGAVVMSAEPAADGDAGVASLRLLGVAFPCDDATLRAAVTGNRLLAAEVESIVAAHGIDVVSYVDALWGLGIMAPWRGSGAS